MADVDAQLGVINNGGLPVGDSTLFALIGPYLRERDPRGIVDADIDELPADALVTVDGKKTDRFKQLFRSVNKRAIKKFQPSMRFASVGKSARIGIAREWFGFCLGEYPC